MLKRPAESAGVGAGIAGLLAHYVFHVNDPDTVAWIGLAIGVIPAGVTFVWNKGLVPIAHRIIYGPTAKR